MEIRRGDTEAQSIGTRAARGRGRPDGTFEIANPAASERHPCVFAHGMPGRKAAGMQLARHPARQGNVADEGHARRSVVVRRGERSRTGKAGEPDGDPAR